MSGCRPADGSPEPGDARGRCARRDVPLAAADSGDLSWIQVAATVPDPSASRRRITVLGPELKLVRTLPIELNVEHARVAGCSRPDSR